MITLKQFMTQKSKIFLHLEIEEEMKALIKIEEQKTRVQINHQSLVQIEKLAQILPILKVMTIEGIDQIHQKLENIEDIQDICNENQALKVYPFSVFVKNQSKQINFYNELKIMRETSKKDFQKIIYLSGCELDQDRILLFVPRYPLLFREHLWRHRYGNQLKILVIDIALGLNEFTVQGFEARERHCVTKALKNYYDRLQTPIPITQSFQETCRGTENYLPKKEDLRDGSTKWDILSLGAMILKLTFKAGYYLRDEKSSKELTVIINRTIKAETPRTQ